MKQHIYSHFRCCQMTDKFKHVELKWIEKGALLISFFIFLIQNKSLDKKKEESILSVSIIFINRPCFDKRLLRRARDLLLRQALLC